MLEWKITGSPRGNISTARERVRVGRCVRCRLTELDECYKQMRRLRIEI
jgi:hypothetical protein